MMGKGNGEKLAKKEIHQLTYGGRVDIQVKGESRGEISVEANICKRQQDSSHFKVAWE